RHVWMGVRALGRHEEWRSGSAAQRRRQGLPRAHVPAPRTGCRILVAYNLADRHDEGELQEVFITQFRETFVDGRPVTGERIDQHVSTTQFAGEYQYVRRARTTMEKMIS